jgi:hypothetical protein
VGTRPAAGAEQARAARSRSGTWRAGARLGSPSCRPRNVVQFWPVEGVG